MGMPLQLVGGMTDGAAVCAAGSIASPRTASSAPLQPKIADDSSVHAAHAIAWRRALLPSFDVRGMRATLHPSLTARSRKARRAAALA
jgi:hypothetical protein